MLTMCLLGEIYHKFGLLFLYVCMQGILCLTSDLNNVLDGHPIISWHFLHLLATTGHVINALLKINDINEM